MASEKIEAIVAEVEKLTVLELSELVSAIEEKFGVTAAAANTDYFNLNNLVVIRINFITSHRLCISFIYFVNPSVCQQTTLQIIL